MLKVGDKLEFRARGLRYLFKIVYTLLQKEERKKEKKSSARLPFSSRSGCILTKSNPNPGCSTLTRLHPLDLPFGFSNWLTLRAYTQVKMETSRIYIYNRNISKINSFSLYQSTFSKVKIMINRIEWSYNSVYLFTRSIIQKYVTAIEKCRKMLATKRKESNARRRPFQARVDCGDNLKFLSSTAAYLIFLLLAPSIRIFLKRRL